MKIQRFKCFIYGRLIDLLLSSSIVFTAKNIILEKDDKEISNFKSFDKVIEYFPMRLQEIFRGEVAIERVLKRLILIIGILGIKSKRKCMETTKEILELLISIPISQSKSAI